MNKKTGTNIFKALYPYVIFMAVNYSILIPIKALNLKIQVYQANILTVVVDFVSLAVVLYIYKRQARESGIQKQNYRLYDLGVKNMLLIYIGTYFILNATGLIGIIFKLNELFPDYSKTAEVIYASPLIWQIIVLVIMAPIIEELLFRGIIYSRMREASNFYVSAAVSSLLWAVAHFNMVQGIATFLFGFFLAFIYEKFKMLLVPMLSHAFFNLIGVVSMHMMYSPSGEADAAKEMTNTLLYIPSLIVDIIIIIILVYFLLKSKFPCKSEEATN